MGRDHPRSRGVYYGIHLDCRMRQGSSPLARGLPSRRVVDANLLGIIPARAGFTVNEGDSARAEPDHPRSRGVYAARKIASDVGRGSSPLARGLLPNSNGDRVVVGIIPARAGFTPDQKDLEAYITDHPRSRGVYDDAVASHHFHPGSSPLARGLRLRHKLGHRQDRIIPARAGFTQWRTWLARSVSDHPRSRGVYIRWGPRVRGRRGSSPLARGLPDKRYAGKLNGGIIPARAGFTLEDPWNPNDESPYQTAFTFTADLALAPQSSDSAAVAQRSTRPPSEA